MGKVKNRLISNTRYFIFRLKDRVPLAGGALVIGWRFFCAVKFITEKRVLKIKAKLAYGGDKLNFDKVYHINPQKIEYCLANPNNSFNKWRNYGRILKRGLDKGIKFEDIDVYRAFKQRFRGSKNWQETKFYKRIFGYIKNGEIKWGCRNKEELDERLKEIDSLYYQIKKHGYKSKENLYSSGGLLAKLEKSSSLLDEVSLAIGGSGQLLFVDGRHRLSIAKLLNLSEIPVRIIARHKKWMDFRRELLAFSKNYQGRRLYQPLTHLDLQDIPHRREDARFKIIKDNLSIGKGTLLDIGANLGYFCHKFEDEGFDCYALEENRMCLYFLKKLKKAEGKKFKIVPMSIFEYNKNKDIVFDVVLALSVFHHFLEQEDTYLSMVNLLKRLKAKELIFESYLPKEFGSRPFYRSYSPEQFVNFIIKNSHFKKAEFIGNSEEGRPLYKFTAQ